MMSRLVLPRYLSPAPNLAANQEITASNANLSTQVLCVREVRKFYIDFSQVHDSPQTSTILSQIHWDKSRGRCLAYIILDTRYQRDGTKRQTHKIVDVGNNQIILLSDYFNDCTIGTCRITLVDAAQATIDPNYPQNITLVEFLQEKANIMPDTTK